MGANDVTAEVFGLFSALIAQFDNFMRQQRRTRQGLIPDLRIRDEFRGTYLADVKTINVGKTRYKASDNQLGKRAAAVDRRARAVHADYHRKARSIDTKYNDTPAGVVGPVDSRLTEFGRIRGLAFGAFAESSTEVFDLIKTISTVGATAPHEKIPESIFVNGNLARVLLASYKLTGNTTHLREGLRWCDTFVGIQLPLETSTGKAGGYWDTGYKEVYIADTGTAVAALAVCHSLAPKPAYENALAKYTLFVTEGCKTAPPTPNVYTNACPPKGRGWINEDGSLGDG